MTHSQTQGAEGAGTKTGLTMVMLPMDDPSRPLPYSDLPPAMIRAGGDAFHRLKRDRSLDADSCSLAVGIYRAMSEAHAKEIATLSPAPAATSDVRSLLRTARSGLATYGAGAFEGTILQIDAILAYDPIFPAPAATPGVPDSVRAQVAATIGRVMCECGPGLATGAGCFEKAADAVLALIAAQPAGQAPSGQAEG